MIKQMLLALVVLTAFATTTPALAQNTFARGNKNLSLGIGVGSYFGPFGSTLGGDGYRFSLPPISLSYEQCILDNIIRDNGSIGVGGYASVATNKWTSSLAGSDYGYRYTYLTFGTRGAFHYRFVDALDTYAGTMLGYNIVSHKAIGTWADDRSYSATANGFAYTAFVGARYAFSDLLSVYAEAGYGISALEIGLTLKL